MGESGGKKPLGLSPGLPSSLFCGLGWGGGCRQVTWPPSTMLMPSAVQLCQHLGSGVGLRQRGSTFSWRGNHLLTFHP